MSESERICVVCQHPMHEHYIAVNGATSCRRIDCERWRDGCAPGSGAVSVIVVEGIDA